MNSSDVIVISDNEEDVMEVVDVVDLEEVEEVETVVKVEEVEKKTMEMVVLPAHSIKVKVKVDVVVNIGGGEMSCKLQIPLRRGDELKWGIGEEMSFYLRIFTKKEDGGVPNKYVKYGMKRKNKMRMLVVMEHGGEEMLNVPCYPEEGGGGTGSVEGVEQIPSILDRLQFIFHTINE